MYYLIRSIVRYVFWLALATAYIILPFVIFTTTPTRYIVGALLFSGLVMLFAYDQTAQFNRKQNLKRIEFAKAYNRHPAVRSQQNGK